jgi:hypothetical protein
MSNTESLPPELAFLDALFPRSLTRYESPWLTNRFDDNEWKFNFSTKRNFIINFDVALEDGSSLTAKKNAELLKTFKNWISVQATPYMNKGILPDVATAKALTRRAIHIIDYLLLKSEKLKLGTYGLKLLTEQDVRKFFYQLSSNPKTSESIYNWTARATAFLSQKSELISDHRAEEFSRSEPTIYKLIETSERIKNLNETQDLKAKIWLAMNKFYSRTTHLGYRLAVPSHRISFEILRNTLSGRKIQTNIEDLNLDPYEGLATEYQFIAVRSETNENFSEREFGKYYKAFMAISKLSKINVYIPEKAIENINFKTLASQLELIPTDRYRTLRPNILLPALKNAVEFCIKYGTDLLKSAEAVMIAQQGNPVGIQDKSFEQTLTNSLAPSIQKIGVRYWSLSGHINYNEKFFDSENVRVFNRADQFNRFRANEGLWELVRVYYGAAQLILGLLMARRQSELISLMPFECLDATRKNLVFFNAKSGFMSKREKIKRPIPDFAVKIIASIQNLQENLKSAGVISSYYPLFTPPNRFGTDLNRSLTSPTYNRSIDFFCDYFETPLENPGRRHYIRQHQLRRGFAMIFFWGNAQGGLDTLRWFLAHTDAQHLYNYITETTPGEVLRGVKSAFIADAIREGDLDVVTELKTLLVQHFNTDNFEILDTTEVEIYLDSLQHEGLLSVEPHFSKALDGSEYRIITKVRSKK